MARDHTGYVVCPGQTHSGHRTQHRWGTRYQQLGSTQGNRVLLCEYPVCEGVISYRYDRSSRFVISLAISHQPSAVSGQPSAVLSVWYDGAGGVQIFNNLNLLPAFGPYPPISFGDRTDLPRDPFCSEQDQARRQYSFHPVIEYSSVPPDLLA